MVQEIKVKISADTQGLVVPAKQAETSLGGIADAAKKAKDSLSQMDGQQLANANKQLQQTGVSAAQTAAAMRQVPAQFTDIVVSLQSGQAPMTVLLQQGGQLKDMFGGVGNAAKALGGYVIGLINPVTAVVAVVTAAGIAAHYGAAEYRAFTDSLILSGNAVGTTAGQMAMMARGIASVSGTQGAAAEALATFAQSAQVGRSHLQEFTGAAMRFASVTGQSVGEVAKQFSDLAKDPLGASLKLNDSMNYLTESTYRQIKSLQDQGRTIEAADVAQKAFADTLDSQSKAMKDNLGILERSWNAVTGAIKGAWDAAKNMGRVAGPEQQLSTVQKQLADRRQSMAEYGNRDGIFGMASTADQIKALEQQESILQSTVRELQKGVTLRAEEAERVKAQSTFDAIVTKNMSDQKRMLLEIEQVRNAGLQARRSEKDIEEQVAAVRLRYAQKTLGGENEVAATRAKIDAAKDYLARLQDLTIATPKLTEAEGMVYKLEKELAGSITGTARALKEKNLEEARHLVALEKNIQSTEVWRTNALKAKEDYAKLVASVGAAADSINQQAAAQEAANAVFGKGTAAVQAMTLAELQHQMAEAQGSDRFTAAYIASLDAKIKAQQRFVDALNAADYKTLNAGLEEWLRSTTEAGRLYEDEARLAGVTGLERAKIVAQREVELRLAKELNTIDKSTLSESEKEVLRQQARDTALVASATATAKAVQDEWTKVSDQIGQSLTDALMRGFEDGKGFAKNMRDTVVNMFKTMVLRPYVQAIVTTGLSATGMGPASSMAGSAASGYAQNAMFGGASMTALGQSFGTGFMTTIQGGSVAEAAAAYNAAGMTGVGGGLSAGASAAAAIPYVAAALAAANAMGVFKSTATVGGGLSGTLGTGDIQRYDLNREDGTLFSGPTYSIANQRMAEQSAAIQTAYSTMRATVAGMATQLGLANDSILGFTQQLGKDIIHPDTGGIGIKLDGLTAEQAQAKISEAMATANEELARQVLGTMKTVTRSVVDQIASGFDGSGGYTEVTRTISEQVYVASEFAKTGETAAATLTRLSSSLGTVNSMFDVLNQTALQASLSGADLASKLVDQFGGADAFTQTTGQYYQAFYSEAERNAKTTEQLTKSLAGLGLTMPDTLDSFRKLVEAQDLTTESGRKAYAALVSLSPAFAQVPNAAGAAAKAQAAAAATLRTANLSAAQSATNAALAQLDRSAAKQKQAVQARIDVATQSVQTLTAVFDLLKSNVTDLYAEVASTASASAAAGRDYITTALATAQKTGYLPDQVGLQGSISAVRAGMGSKPYASAFDAERDRLVLAGQLSQLKDISGDQLTESEKMLKVAKDQLDGIDAQVALAHEQVDALRGVDTSITSLADAIVALTSAKVAEQSAKAGAAYGAASGAATDVSSIVQQAYAGIGRTGMGSGVNNIDAAGYSFWTNALQTGAVSAADFADQFSNSVNGYLWSKPQDELSKYIKSVRGYASGGLHSGGLRLVGERGPELEVTGPARYYTASDTKSMLSGGGADQTAEIRALRDELAAQSRAMVQNQVRMNRLFERWDGEGLPTARSTV